MYYTTVQQFNNPRLDLKGLETSRITHLFSPKLLLPLATKTKNGDFHADGKQAENGDKQAENGDFRADGKQADSKQADSKQADSKQADSKQADSKQADSKQAD